MTTTVVPGTRRSSERLLLAGALAGPVFFASSITQMLAREGFDITRHPLSQLANGGSGWLQVLTFVLAGLGVLALAVGARRTLLEGVGRRVLPIFIGVFGAGLVASGLFTMDPENGFPVGTPEGPVAQMSWHSIAHSAAAATAFTALAAAAVVLAVRHARGRRARPAVLSAATALVLLLPVSPELMSIQVAVNGLVAFTWTTVVALSLRDTA
ncbi:DUF998 domain-containing protein [Actinokineospora sp. UTMC 2448]|uniref:DUF998 domain-containing protein n=1 Tax=Actinokineospora sp. UTMC 2448 TaxID=2268449 RepID=UPI0021647DC5|nr:DUF998 domain-containing protein [Actinokineospora sp. UTMC 2448]UVS79582.1 hypothetical protein Actkin_03332 [Actinokineospora sp. UTMC 2448]